MKKISFCSLLLILVSCSFERAQDPLLVLKTDREFYEATESIQIDVRNVSSSNIYYSTCMPTKLERIDGEQITGVLSFPTCECLCPALLKPNESWTHEISLDWLDDTSPIINPDTDYRIHLSFYHDEEMKLLLDEAELYTNRFGFLSK